MEHNTFTQPEVQAALANVVLLQADVTKNDDEDKALLRALRHRRPADHRLLWRGRSGTAKLPRRRFHEGCGVRGRDPASGRSGDSTRTVKSSGSSTPRLLGAALIVIAAGAAGFFVYRAEAADPSSLTPVTQRRSRRRRRRPVPTAPPAARSKSRSPTRSPTSPSPIATANPPNSRALAAGR